MPASRCMWRRCTGPTIITSRNPASRALPGHCGQRWRSTHGRPARCPRPRGGLAAERPSFRDGFAWGAFLVAPLWMLRHRLWLALVLYIVVAGAIGAGAAFYHVPAGITAAVAFLLSLLLGFEASSVRRWSLTRRRWTNVGVVIGDDVEVAERRFFDAWIRRPSAPAGAPAAPAGNMRAAG